MLRNPASGIRVIKIGGGELEDPVWLERFAAAVKAVLPAVIVHGGGRKISQWQQRLGIPVEMRDGVRVTTLEVAELAQMVLCGPIRAKLLRALKQHGIEAVGLAGGDGCFEVELVDPDKLGRVGRVVRADRESLLRLIEAGFTPVLAPSSTGPDGLPVNVNADEAAAAVARALEAEELIFVSDVPGVLRDGKAIGTLGAEEFRELVSCGVVRGGMVAKLSAALASGCRRVRIGDLAALYEPERGTVVLGEAAA
ncbi:MAG: acetylglutamate kinase [Gemmatimonadales bacterium]|nr:MAG: acetylglutamate kinase [Gemmatimonadales bacterium]